MHLLTLTQAGPPRHGETVFREGRLGKFIALLVLAGVLGAMGAGWRAGKLPTPVLLIFGSFTFLFFLLLLWTLRRAAGPEGWVVRVAGRQILVKFRSYQNEHFADDELAVVSLSDDEIEWAGLATEKSLSRHKRDGLRIERTRCLDLRLRDAVDTAPLAAALQAERAHPLVGGRAKSKSNHSPARLTDDGRTLRVPFAGQGSSLTPRPRQALAALKRLVPIRDDERRETYDYRAPATANQAAAESKILELVERGQMIDATQLARRTYKCSLSEAKEFVESLGTTAGRPTSEIRR